ncbi:hypothetical protein CLV92_104113 [Kineococcus xinjiangensis]|uniref:AAA domain-containing protein n=1 Tax=Kineococcus xinjiangensis TaxID=512762 RepID=A0A2S6ISR1_9ACTN|nr:hypothetical protein [Kineococcus xinjiangensis]PPK97294.1 hypothetical protein CLV92_104113 [Kineococcus xinjiangensis]
MTAVDASAADHLGGVLPGWLDELAAAGGPTGLLHCPDAGAGALELTTAHPSGLAQLLAGRPARLSSLVRETGAFAEARRRAREVHVRAEELREQHGLESACLAVGLATWTPPGTAPGLPVRAPVLLRRCGLRPVGTARDDYEIQLTAGITLNPVLRRLAAEHGIALDAAAIAASAVGGRGFDPVPAYSTLGGRLQRVPGFRIERRLLLGTFADPGAAAARDVAELSSRLREHPVLTRLAGAARPGAGERTDDGPAASAEAPETTETPTDGPALLLDLDPQQREAVERALAGEDLSVDAPAGTGATQVAAALVATLAGRGRRTLLLAEAASELRAVNERIAAAGAGRLLLHVRDAGGGAEAVDEQLTAAARAVLADGEVLPPLAGGAAGAEEHARSLAEHATAEHRVRAPWGVSAAEAREALAELAERPLGPRTTRRLRGESLTSCRREDLPVWAAKLAEAAELGAFTVTPATTPWAGARLTTDEGARAVAGSLQRIVEELLPAARARMAVLDEQAGLRGADTVAGWLEQLRLLRGVRSSVERFGPDLYRRSLADVAAATAGPQQRREQGVRMGWWRRWRLRRQARALLVEGVTPTGMDELHEWLQSARAQRLEWQRASGCGGSPHVPAELADAESAVDALVAELDALAEVLPERCGGVEGLRRLPLPELAALLRSLRADAAALDPLPRRTVLLAELAEGGWQPLLEDVGARWSGPGSVDLLAEVETAWWAGVLEAVSLEDPHVGAVDAAHLRQVRADYALADRAAAAAAAAGVRLAVDALAAEALRALGPWPEPAGRGARTVQPRPVVDVLRAAGERARALLPCWAMGPLAVAEAVPADEVFDVLVVLGGERTGLSAVLPGLARARQLVVIGDRESLPPLPFSTVAAAPPDVVPVQGGRGPGRGRAVPALAPPRVPAALEALPAEGAAPSLSAVADAVLPTVRLRTQHACRDERLLRPLLAAADRPAGPDQVVLPGAAGAEVVRVVQVAARGTGRRAEPTLVEAVVAAVVEHVRRWPHESLGVVAPDADLARELDEVVRRGLAEALGVPTRTAAGQEVPPPWPLPGMDPLHVAEVERWRATRRDAVVLVVPAGAAGAEAAAASPLASTAVGRQRVALALSRCRVRTTVVAEELPPTALAAAPGERLLRGAVEQWGRCAGDPAPAGGAEVGALVRRLAAACAGLGLPVVTGAGHGHPVDLLVGEPAPAGGGAGAEGAGPAGAPLWHRGVLAVELDGPRWAAAPSLRERERGRPEELERAGWRYVRCLGADALADVDAEARRLASLWREQVEGGVWEAGR